MSVAASAPRLRSVIMPVTCPPTIGLALSVSMERARSVAVGNAVNETVPGFAESGIAICGGSNRKPEREGVRVIAPAAGKAINVTRPLSSVVPWTFTAPANCTVTFARGRKSRRATLTANALLSAAVQGSSAVGATRTPTSARPGCRKITLIRACGRQSVFPETARGSFDGRRKLTAPTTSHPKERRSITQWNQRCRAQTSGQAFSPKILADSRGPLRYTFRMSDSDSELLARYSRQDAEEAFAELVRRHLGLVY